MIKQFKKLRKSGNSLIMTIDKDIVDKLNLHENDIIELEILKVKHIKEIKTYMCNNCKYEFDQDVYIPYCPICGDEKYIIEVDMDVE